MIPTEIGRLEAAELLSATLGAVLRANGVRALVFKGVVAHRHGLREERGPADVDVIVHPRDFEAAEAIILESGWRPRPLLDHDNVGVTHSRAYIREGWPCDVDLHHRFPGIGVSPREAFEVLWGQRESMAIAGLDCLVPDLAASAVLAALHCARNGTGDSHAVRELASLSKLLERDPSGAVLSDLLRTAEALGCHEQIVAVLALGSAAVRGAAGPSTASSAIDSYQATEWRLIGSGGRTETQAWLVALGSVRGMGRIRVLRSALFPSAQHFSRPGEELGNVRLQALRCRRLMRGGWRLPGHAWRYWRARRSVAGVKEDRWAADAEF